MIFGWLGRVFVFPGDLVCHFEGFVVFIGIWIDHNDLVGFGSLVFIEGFGSPIL